MATESRQTDPFSKIKFKGYGDLIIEQGESHVVTIEGDERVFSKITTKVKKDEMRISVDFSNPLWFISPPKFQIIVIVPSLSKLTVTGGGHISCRGRFEANEFTLLHSGIGEVEFNVEAGNVKIQLSGTGKIRMRGQAKNARIENSGIGKIDAFDFVTDECLAINSGAGECLVFAIQSLDARMTGIGSIRYQGNPQNLKKRSSGIGRIQEAENQGSFLK